MIWATVSSWPCFCWLYRASPSLAEKNIISLTFVLTIWWCLCAESSLVLLEEGFAMTNAFSWQNSISLCPASICTPRPNLPVTPGVSWLPIFAFQSPIMKLILKESQRKRMERNTSCKGQKAITFMQVKKGEVSTYFGQTFWKWLKWIFCQ